MSTHEATLTLTLFAAMATLQLAGSHGPRSHAAAPDLPPAVAAGGLRLTFGSFLGVSEVLEGLAAAGALEDPELAAYGDLLRPDGAQAH